MAHLAFTTLERLVQLLRTVPIREGAYVSVLDRGQLGVGRDPLHITHAVDLAREAVVYRGQDELPMDLGPSLDQQTETSTTNGPSSPHSTTNKKDPSDQSATNKKEPSDSKVDCKENGNASAGKRQTSLMRRLEGANR